MVGYFNTVVAERQGVFDGVPAIVKYFIMAFSGTGPLWFIQVLWLLCLFLLLVRVIDRKDKIWNWCGKANLVVIILLGVLFWAGEQTLIKNPRPESLDGLLNLYKPLFYLVPFLLGYFVFSHDEVQEKLKKAWIPLLACAVVAGTVLVVTTFGQDNTSPKYLGSPLNCLYGWLMCLAMMAWFKARFDRTGAFAGYMTRSSYGIYILHYLVIAALGYMMKQYTSLAPWMMYVILFVAVMTIPVALYEIIRRIPVIRWCVLGETKR
jgi:surface polysaccharide O-acyltransferase-like enzyme